MKTMKTTLFGFCLLTGLLVFQVTGIQGQDGTQYNELENRSKVRFNGLGRTYLGQTRIGGPFLQDSQLDGMTIPGDSATPRSLTDGEFLLDLQVNATPNDKTEVQAILRLRNEFGGFFGAGMLVEVRELWARGIIANAVEYRVGDMDVAMTPYTFYNFDEEGMINEAAAFGPQREVIYYEQFYGDGNTRRVQGGKFDFGLNFTRGLKSADFSAFLARVRGTDFFTVPTRFTSGGQAKFSTVTFNDSLGLKADFGFNLLHTFDDLKSGDANTGIRNTVFSGNWDVTIMDRGNLALHALGETGRSSLESLNDSISFFKTDDTFLDFGAKAIFKKQKIALTASFVDVGPDFFSIGAQSRRVDYTAQKSYYDRIGNNDVRRQAGLFDLTRDRALYTYQLSDRLMNYDPRFSNTMPYGTATPNRRGAKIGVEYGLPTDKIEGRLDAALMSEIRGQGTFELKNFTLVRAAANVNIHHYLDWERHLRFTLGYQYENTTRDGNEVQAVDLTSNLVELGLEVEVFRSFELLVGAKLLSAEGTDYVPRIGEFNIVEDFPSLYTADDREALLAGGIKYTFKKGIYLTIQYQQYVSELGSNNPLNYDLGQVFALYTMNF